MAVFAAAAYEMADAVIIFVGPLGGLTWIGLSQLMKTKENGGREVWLTGRIVAVIYSFEERHVRYDGGRGGLCEDTGSQEKDWMKVHDAYIGPRMFVMSRTVMYKKKEDLMIEYAFYEEMMMRNSKHSHHGDLYIEETS